VNFNLEITDSGPHLSAACPDNSLDRALPAQQPPRAPCRRRRRLARAAVAPTVASHAPPASRSPRRPRRRPDRSSLIDAVPPSAIPAPVSRCSLAASSTPASCHRRLAEQRHRASRARSCRAGRFQAGPRTWAVPHVAAGRAAHCASGSSGFGPVAPG
jgi:hypothetical protein